MPKVRKAEATAPMMKYFRPASLEAASPLRTAMRTYRDREMSCNPRKKTTQFKAPATSTMPKAAKSTRP